MRPILPAILLILIGLCLVISSGRGLKERNGNVPFVAMGMVAVFGGVAVIREGHRRSRFIQWLVDNRRQVETTGARLGGQLISPATELREYNLVVSIIIFSFRIPSRYFVPPHRSSVLAAVYSLLSATCGWWGFPYGPVYTLQSLFWNLQGGRHVRVRDVYAGLDEQVAAHTEEQRLKSRSFLSGELTPMHKVAIGVIIVALALLIYDYLSGR